MPVRVVSTRDQQPITVNSLVKSPLVVPERIVSSLRNQFVMDQVLRDAGQATGGAIQFRVSSGVFADNASEIVAEGAEIPVATVTRGDLQSKPVQKRALAVIITEEMRLRNAVGEVERQIMAVRNTLTRDIDGQFVTALTAAVTLTRAATAAWSGAGATIRKDILAARRLVSTATVPGIADSYLAFEPDTILFNPVDEANLLGSAEFTSLIFGQNNPSNVSALDDIPNGNVLGLRPLVSVSVPAGTAYVGQSKVGGGYADERPLQATELYRHNPTETYRSDALRSTVAFIDQPLAWAKVTGV